MVWHLIVVVVVLTYVPDTVACTGGCESRGYLILMMERLQGNNGYRLLTVEVGLVWVVHKHAIILRVANAIAVNIRIALVSLAVAVGIQLIGIGYFGTVVYAVLNAVPVVRIVLIIN